MSDRTMNRLAWVFVGLIGAAAILLLTRGGFAVASGDHDLAQQLRQGGEILPLADLLGRPDLAEGRVIEAELEREYGRAVYEIEVLMPDGRVYERYFDATTGEPLD